MREMIRIQKLTYGYTKEKLFSDFSVTIEEGTITAFAGSNGSGKSTLIKLMAGLLPNKNAIVLEHSYINNKRIEDSARQVGVVLSDLDTQFLFDDAYQELCFPLENLKYPKEQIEERVIDVATLLKMKPVLDKKIASLSVCERKKLSFALAILHEPKVLLLDNPFSMMAEKERLFFRDILQKLKKEHQMTIVLATNNLTDTINSDYLYVLEQGKIAVEGQPLVVMQEDQLLNRLGLELPFMVDLSLKLKFYDVIDSIEVEMERMVNTLWK